MYYPSLHGESPGALDSPWGPRYIRVLHVLSPWEPPHFSDEECCLEFLHSSGRGGLSTSNWRFHHDDCFSASSGRCGCRGLTVTLASCDLGGGSDSKDSGASTSASALKSAQAGASGNGGNGAVSESHTTSIDGKAGTVSLNSVSGTGTTVTVMFSVTNNDKKNDMWIYDSFSDGDDSVPQPAERRAREEYEQRRRPDAH